MTILDGGHGLGLHVEPRAGGGSEIWLSLQARSRRATPTVAGWPASPTAPASTRSTASPGA